MKGKIIKHPYIFWLPYLNHFHKSDDFLRIFWNLVILFSNLIEFVTKKFQKFHKIANFCRKKLEAGPIYFRWITTICSLDVRPLKYSCQSVWWLFAWIRCPQQCLMVHSHLMKNVKMSVLNENPGGIPCGTEC
jgi:hypothetical protein